MPNSDIGEVAHAIGSITDLVGGILTRSDRDKPEKELHENLVQIQNAFAANSTDSDEFRLFVDKLCNGAGHTLTPTRNPDTGRRELIHNLLVIAAEHVYARQIMSRLTAKTVENK